MSFSKDEGESDYFVSLGAEKPAGFSFELSTLKRPIDTVDDDALFAD